MSDAERNDIAQGEERRLFTGQRLAGHHHLLPIRKAARSRSAPRSRTSCGQPRPDGCGRHRAESPRPAVPGERSPCPAVRTAGTRRRAAAARHHNRCTCGGRAAPSSRRKGRAPCPPAAGRALRHGHEAPPPRVLADYGLVTRDPPAHRRPRRPASRGALVRGTALLTHGPPLPALTFGPRPPLAPSGAPQPAASRRRLPPASPPLQTTRRRTPSAGSPPPSSPAGNSPQQRWKRATGCEPRRVPSKRAMPPQPPYSAAQPRGHGRCARQAPPRRCAAPAPIGPASQVHCPRPAVPRPARPRPVAQRPLQAVLPSAPRCQDAGRFAVCFGRVFTPEMHPVTGQRAAEDPHAALVP